jgi:hypothetical protein
MSVLTGLANDVKLSTSGRQPTTFLSFSFCLFLFIFYFIIIIIVFLLTHVWLKTLNLTLMGGNPFHNFIFIFFTFWCRSVVLGMERI